MMSRGIRSLIILASATCTLSACQALSSFTKHWKSWTVVPLETAEMKAEKIEKNLEKGRDRYVPALNAPLGSFGLNLEMYLERPATPEERLARLEQAVIALHKDLQILAPEVQKLSSRDGSVMMVRDVNDQIDADAPPVTLQKKSATSPRQKKAMDKVINALNPSGGPFVQAVRTGRHPGITRLVFDVTHNMTYSVDLDNEARILVVEFAKTDWNSRATSRSFPKHPLLKSYKVSNFGSNNEGKIFALELNKSSEIIKHKVLPALSGSGKRIFIDLRS